MWGAGAGEGAVRQGSAGKAPTSDLREGWGRVVGLGKGGRAWGDLGGEGAPDGVYVRPPRPVVFSDLPAAPEPGVRLPGTIAPAGGLG